MLAPLVRAALGVALSLFFLSAPAQAAQLPPANLDILDGLSTFACPRPAGRLDQILYDGLKGQGASLSCGNEWAGLWDFQGETSAEQPFGRFHDLAGRIRGAKNSVLLANMIWDAGKNAPGRLVASALADLRREVLAHPERYPQGMSVRLLLGNSVRLGLPADTRANLDYMVADLLRAGLDLSGQRQGGWRLDIANFSSAVPHSHLKLLVIDGEEVWAGGYNISTYHLAPALGGQGLHDLAIGFRGPIARHGVAAFHDTWSLSQRVTCPSGVRAANVLDLRRLCILGGESAPFDLLWPPLTPSGKANVYGLYRRSGLTEADAALTALIGGAQHHIDLLQAQVSGQLSCTLGLGAPRTCDLRTQGLPVWQAVAAALRRGVKVRLVLSDAYPMALESVALVRSLQEAVAGTAGEGGLQVRWASHRTHTKLIAVDGEMVVVGSTNLHYSSFGEGGLSEYNLASSDAGALSAAQRVVEREWASARAFSYPWWAR